VTVHVIQAPVIGGVGADAGSPGQEAPLWGAALGVVTIEVGLARRQRLAEGERRGAPGAAGVLPLRLGGQAINTAGPPPTRAPRPGRAPPPPAWVAGR